ncbi:MAG: C4-type zinc ribbon domain-containing protein [Acidobacteria bacterium]|nr:C4-type zinc ribbon domain-containing protein [Acidobacteriota bacterium]
MSDQIRGLVELQKIAFEIKEIRDLQARTPERLAALEDAFRQKVEEIGSARLTHEALTAERQRLVRQREETLQRQQQAQQKLMQVSNTREYSAALNEIDSNKSAVAAIDDKVAEIDLQLEELSGPAAEADERIAAARLEHDAEKGRMETEAASSSDRLRELEAQREQIKVGIPRDFVARFDTIFNARGGVAVARIVGNACGACHVRLRPQIINLVKRGEDLSFCESCRRILYIAETEGGEGGGADAPTPGAARDAAGKQPGQGLTPAGA